MTRHTHILLALGLASVSYAAAPLYLDRTLTSYSSADWYGPNGSVAGAAAGLTSASSIANIIGTATVSGGGLTSGGELTSSSRSVLDAVLNVELGDPTRNIAGRIPIANDQGGLFYVTSECYRAISAIKITDDILMGGRTFNAPGFFITNWKRVNNSNPDPGRFHELGRIGRTVFFGLRLWF